MYFTGLRCAFHTRSCVHGVAEHAKFRINVAHDTSNDSPHVNPHSNLYSVLPIDLDGGSMRAGDHFECERHHARGVIAGLITSQVCRANPAVSHYLLFVDGILHGELINTAVQPHQHATHNARVQRRTYCSKAHDVREQYGHCVVHPEIHHVTGS